MNNACDIKKLKGSENYHTWVYAIRNILTLKGFQKFIDEESTESDATKRDQCKATLALSVDESIYVHIQGHDTPFKIWKALKDLYEDKGLSRKIGLLRNLISTRLETSESMQSYIDNIVTNSNKLTGVGFALTDEWLAAIILAGLTDEYRPFIMGIEASNQAIKSDSIISKLLDTPTRTNSNAEALFSKSKSGVKRKVKCFYCKKKGHTANECRVKKSDEAAKNANNGAQKAKAAFIAKCNVTKTAYAAAGTDSHRNEWYVDSGASSHMTPHKQLLVNMKPAKVVDVTSANNAKLNVKGVGDTVLRLNDIEVPVNNVLHVPELSANLLSVFYIVSKGNSVTFDANGCTIRNTKSEIVAQCQPKNGVYKFSSNDGTCMLSRQNECAFIWHRRLGHLNYQTMQKMRDHAVDGINFADDEQSVRNCEICAKAKQSRLPFSQSKSQASKILEIIHSDLMGPMETQSLGKARYILTFVDDLSKKVFTYFLGSKSEVLDKFMEFKSLVENQADNKIKILRTDNGTEYGSNEFKRFCKANGIQHQLTTVYTPQQNGVAERMNRTIVEKAKCLLFDADLPKRFWAEATNMAVYLINRTISSSHGKVPEEIFSGKRMNVSDLKIFGSPVMVHIPKERRKKWDSKSQKLIFVGPDGDCKGYRCIDRKTGKLTISRDVIFHEPQARTTFDIIDGDIDSVEDTEDEPETEIIEVQDSSADPINENEAETTFENANDTINESETDENSTMNDSDYVPDEPLGPAHTERMATRNRTRGNTSRPFQLINFALLVEPSTVTEAMNDSKASHWKKAMDEEMESHRQNNTWSLVALPNGRKAIKAKWVFKTKEDNDGNIIRYKARLVAKGCSQKYGIDYSETFSPVVRYNSVRFLIALAVQRDMTIHQMDAVTAFLQGDLREEIFMEQPEYYEDGTNRVCRLNRSIYGLKQAGRQWNLKLDNALRKFGLKKSQLDPCIYYSDDLSVLIAIYVDDFLIFFRELGKLNEIKQYLHRTFRMKDLGAVSSCIGMRIKQSKNAIEIDQSGYIEKILERFGMTDSKPVKTPSDTSQKLSIQTTTPNESLVGQVPFQEAVGSLLYLTQSTRPDIAFAVNDVSRFNINHDSTHWRAVKRIFRYLRGTTNAKLRFTKSNDGIMAYSDADWASEVDSRRSCSGFVIKLANASICWMSKRQPIVALSSTEAEYIALSSVTCELMWLKQLADELDKNIAGAITIFCDNQSSIKLASSDAYRPRTKHIDIRFHRIRELVEAKVIDIDFVSTGENAADVLTKAVSAEKTQYCSGAMGLQFA